MIVDVRDAILALLEATGNTVHDGLVPPKPTWPYVVLWATGPRWETSRLCGVQSNADVLFATTCVAMTGGDAAVVQRNVHGVLVDAQLTVAGWACQRIKHEDTQTQEVDYDARPPVVAVVDVWRLYLTPA